MLTLNKINDSKANDRKFIGKEDFLNNIYDIPLKYISYLQEANKNYFSLYYSFDYAKYPIENEVNNYIVKQRFNSNSEGDLKGHEFENIIKHKFILDNPLFDIDSFIIVEKIINMKFSEEFKNITIEHLKQKNVFLFLNQIFRGRIMILQFYIQKKKKSYSSKQNINLLLTILIKKVTIQIQKKLVLLLIQLANYWE